jgi:hypothetical protein
VPPKSPEDEAKTFYLPPGYRLELVAAEPQVISPAVIEFDGNGRMYVAEFVSYMLDADGTGAHDPISHHQIREHQGRQKYDNARSSPINHPAAHDPATAGRSYPHERDRLDDVTKLTTPTATASPTSARSVAHGIGRRQPRARAERLRVGARQLDLQHVQRVSISLDAHRLHPRTDRR